MTRNLNLRNASAIAWLVLIGLTLASWQLGTLHTVGGANAVVGVTVLIVAVFKVRLVGLYFMELRDAPWQLRGIFEFYCLAIFSSMTILYLLN